MIKENVQILVIGAGPSGCVASAYLNKQGIKVKVVEKCKFPRPVVGESLIPRVMDHFDEVGLIPALMKEGFEKKWGARFIRGNEMCVFNFSEKHGEGWDWTWQVPRARFDEVISNEVQNQGVDIEFETEVVDVQFENGKSISTLKKKNGEIYKIQSEFIIDSSGYGRVLPKLLNLDTPSSMSLHSSIFAHVEDINRSKYENANMITFDIIETDVWLWVIPFSNGQTSIGIVGPTDYINKLSSDGDTKQGLLNAINSSEFYKKRFENLEFLFNPVLLKNYSCSVKKMYGNGFALTGNSSEFLDPVFSSGIAFATESGILSAKLACKQIKGEIVDWEVEYEKYMKKGISVFSTYVKEWYTGNLQKIFFHVPANEDVKRGVCAVLAGYVWDETNPFVKKHENVIKNMAYMLNK